MNVNKGVSVLCACVISEFLSWKMDSPAPAAVAVVATRSQSKIALEQELRHANAQVACVLC